MKRLFFLPLLLGFISPVMAKEICTLTSEVEPDVTITLKYTGCLLYTSDAADDL